jgi:hypothetical protein
MRQDMGKNMERGTGEQGNRERVQEAQGGKEKKQAKKFSPQKVGAGLLHFPPAAPCQPQRQVAHCRQSAQRGECHPRPRDYPPTDTW